MSENRNRDFSKYDSMTTEELEEILRLDANIPEDGESDVELLLYVMGVLANREKRSNTGKTALEAWESFQQHYLPEEGTAPEHISKKKTAPWLRRLIAVAAAVALVICIPLTVHAFSWEEIWNVFARWAKETFSFVSDENAEVSEPESNDNLEYQSLQDALQMYGIDTELAPTWIPSGYVLDSVEQDISPIHDKYIATYRKEGQLLTIYIQSYVVEEPEKIEVNEELIEIYVSSDVEYYIFSNVEQIRAVWILDSYECYISGELTIDELKAMIDSIRKG